MQKKESRLRRAKKARSKIKSLGMARLTVHRTPRHIYAQIFSADGSRVLASASTVESAIRNSLGSTGNIQAAQIVGKEIAQRAVRQGIIKIAFDRSGFRYHGRVKALADSARENGLQF